MLAVNSPVNAAQLRRAAELKRAADLKRRAKKRKQRRLRRQRRRVRAQEQKREKFLKQMAEKSSVDWNAELEELSSSELRQRLEEACGYFDDQFKAQVEAQGKRFARSYWSESVWSFIADRVYDMVGEFEDQLSQDTKLTKDEFWAQSTKGGTLPGWVNKGWVGEQIAELIEQFDEEALERKEEDLREQLADTLDLAEKAAEAAETQ